MTWLADPVVACVESWEECELVEVFRWGLGVGLGPVGWYALGGSSVVAVE